MRKLTKEQKRDIRAIAAKRDEDIDFSDAPAVVDWSEAEIGKFYRPTKKPVTMRLDSDVIAWLKADGRGFQTKANGLLRHAMLHYTREKGLSKREGFRRKTAQQKEWLDHAEPEKHESEDGTVSRMKDWQHDSVRPITSRTGSSCGA